MSVTGMRMVSNPLGTLATRVAEDVRLNRVALLAALNLNLGDALSTHIGLASGVQEGNPIPAALMAGGGEFAWLASKFGLMALMVLMVCLLGRRYPKLWHTFTITNLVLLAAIISNSAQILAL